ncbi:hypothetical protein LTR48_001054 [Friedmanniomyces endolithicus]|uniref:Ferric oxidoreductase domain-containing protein n=1 Tax=Rachicladosporium monterosium TaxID=1507873 RepID=A0ABR0LDK0_9PEZI|nr:hypothetical protein LTR48_001054 [Friedmanniomyces endolithicus]KAK5147236.1 hypothetical protein LTR32_001290 [Rachicladosporium monterosium]
MHHHAARLSYVAPDNTATSQHELIARAAAMAPRAAAALSLSGAGPVTDSGTLLSNNTPSSPYSQGLNGVQQVDNYLFINILLAAFLGVLAATVIYRWLHMLNGHLRLLLTMGVGKLQDQRYWMYNHGSFWPSVKKNLLYAPLGKTRHNREVQLSKAISVGTLPSRFHTVLLGLYLATNVGYCLALTWRRENEFSVIAQLRGRTGSLAAFNLIPTVLFALRNNPLIPITRVSYDTFNLLHRWCARVVVLETILHTICWAVNIYESGGMKQIHGPYGGHESMASYGTVLLFAGGVGITHCVGYVHHLLLQCQAGTSSTHKIVLVWSVPNTEALEWVRIWMDQILKMEGRREVLRIQLFVTKPRHRGEVISNTGSVQMFPGRCNPKTIVEKEMGERIGAMGVTVCGPGAFSDSVRAAVREVVTEGAVDFVEEAFTY